MASSYTSLILAYVLCLVAFVGHGTGVPSLVHVLAGIGLLALIAASLLSAAAKRK